VAENILEKSATYVRQTDEATRRRRTVVSKHLKDNFKVTRGRDAEVRAKIIEELKAEDIEITDSSYETDKAVFRCVYTWLKAREADRQEIYVKATPQGRYAIDAFKTDGLTQWSHMGLDDGNADAESDEPEEAPRPKLDLAKLEGGPALLVHLQGVADFVARTVEEDELLKSENARLSAENMEISERIKDVEEYNGYADGEIARLEEELRLARDNARSMVDAKLEQIAERYPDYPELAEIARKIKNGKGQRQQKLDELIGRLPKSFAWQNDKGAIEYKPTFTKLLGDLASDEQEQLMTQLVALAEHGMDYSSLYTNKIKYRLPHSPLNCFCSRVASDIRFTWTKNGHLTIHWLFRKGDSRTGQVEG
jgi:hypothetical protein